MNTMQEDKYCCETMKNNFIDKGFKTIKYYSKFREYSVALKDGSHILIQHCPWCGIKLPKSLWNEWEEILEKEFGIIELYSKNKDKIPKEFKTDEWWKKRGL